MPSLEERRLLERRKLQGLFTMYREALRNGHSFLGSDGQEHAIKLVDRSNRRAFARTETAASNLFPHTRWQMFCDRECQHRDQFKRQYTRKLKQKGCEAIRSAPPPIPQPKLEHRSMSPAKRKPVTKKVRTPSSAAAAVERAAAKTATTKRAAAKRKPR